ncbi:MAG: DUF2264 domain-containing protein [Spirochaetales bacterium]|nr:DUF2264 domain-containing protein [Spirochaetales bacterium]
MIHRTLAQNALKTRQDLENALLDMLKPYLVALSPGSALVDARAAAATFSERAVEVEGFSRLLWGIVPLLAGTADRTRASELAALVVKGISSGTDPHHREYWGPSADYDQRLVEMAAFAYALLLVPGLVWEPLGKKGQDNLVEWLLDINRKQIPDCNWVFFRILVNCALIKLDRIPEKSALLGQAFTLVEQFYLDDKGWYNDGFPDKRRARDYYIPWAMHFYGLLFAGSCADLFPVQAQTYRERALRFAPEYSKWFDTDGNALPFGRSLTYRFAQAAFWGALPLAFSEGPDWQQVRTIFMANLRWWLSQPAFEADGRLSVGYTYPNRYMAERYNSDNSPLWAFKAFAPLAVADYHPFWTCGEHSRAAGTENSLQTGTGLYICTRANAGHHYALNAGQWTPGISNEHLHMAEKYGKFAYSSCFGFNVITDAYGIDKLAADNMLLLGEDDEEGYYRYRKQSENHGVHEHYLYSEWRPYGDVRVQTWLVPVRNGSWHIRVHRIESGRVLVSAEGGFPLAFGNDYYPLPNAEDTKREGSAVAVTGSGKSRIIDLAGKRNGYIIPSSPNANIMYPRTVVPVLKGTHAAGIFKLACAVFASPDPAADSTPPTADDLKERLPEGIWNETAE